MERNFARECNEYLDRKGDQLNVGSMEIWEHGPSYSEIMATPLFYFPAFGFPLVLSNVTQMMVEFKAKLSYAPYPKDSIRHKIQELEREFGLQEADNTDLPFTSQQRMLADLVGDIQFGLQKTVYRQVMSMSDKPLIEVLDGIKHLPTDCENWKDDPAAWQNLYHYIEYYVENTFLLQSLRALLADINSGTPSAFPLSGLSGEGYSIPTDGSMDATVEENDTSAESSVTVTIDHPRWNWTGTPQEAAKAIDLFIEQGYLEPLFDNKQKAMAAMRIFRIVTERGTEVTLRSMQEYFGSKKMSDPMRQFRLPKSANYGKGEKT